MSEKEKEVVEKLKEAIIIRDRYYANVASRAAEAIREKNIAEEKVKKMEGRIVELEEQINCVQAKADNADRKPVVLHSENGNLYSYINTVKYEAFDELETKEIQMKDGLYIAFNPQFLADAFSIVDSDNPVCIGTNAKSPMLITGNEYSFLVLPVNITSDEYLQAAFAIIGLFSLSLSPPHPIIVMIPLFFTLLTVFNTFKTASGVWA